MQPKCEFRLALCDEIRKFPRRGCEADLWDRERDGLGEREALGARLACPAWLADAGTLDAGGVVFAAPLKPRVTLESRLLFVSLDWFVGLVAGGMLGGGAAISDVGGGVGGI